MPSPAHKHTLYSEKIRFERDGQHYVQCRVSQPTKSQGNPGSFVRFLVNGCDTQRCSFEGQLPDTTLFPMVSVFRDSSACINFGPEFVHPPPPDAIPWSQLYGNDNDDIL